MILIIFFIVKRVENRIKLHPTLNLLFKGNKIKLNSKIILKKPDKIMRD